MYLYRGTKKLELIHYGSHWTTLLHIRYTTLLANIQQIVYHQGFLRVFLSLRSRFELFGRFRSVESWYGIEGRIGSLAFPAGSGPEVLFARFCFVEFARGGHGILRLGFALVPLKRVEPLARQVRREAVGRGSCRCQLPPHRMSHGRHVGPREGASGEEHVPDEGLYGRLADESHEEELFYDLRADCP